MGRSILVVDDSAVTRSAIKRIIGMVGLDDVEVLEADSGSAALKEMENHHVDLVLSDLNMPEMTGVEMVRRMRSSTEQKSTPVVVISTNPDAIQADELLAEGIAAYLHKPFTPEDIREVLMNIWGDKL
ncbi:MAG: response regulator [Phycisphaerae bacterium]|nr:response regulator [Phycisphaerae bacterium]